MSKLHPSLHPIKYQRTFVLIKPDGVKRGLTGDIIHRIEKTGLKVVAMKMIQADEATIRNHYPVNDEAWIERLGTKSLSGFDNTDADPVEVLGSDDKKVLGKQVSETFVEYLSSGPIVIMIIEGTQSIDMVRKLAGYTLPFKADVGTIRGDYSVDSPSIANAEHRSVHNILHASETTEEAANEIKLWFGEDLVHNYSRAGEDIMFSRYY